MTKNESLQRKINGLCRDCGEVAPYKGYTRCVGCLGKLQEKRRVNRQAKLQQKKERLSALAVTAVRAGSGNRRMFASTLPTDANQPIIVTEGEPGYCPFGDRCNDPESAAALVDRFNRSQGVSYLEARAARSASMFGWHRFAALCEMYGRRGA